MLLALSLIPGAVYTPSEKEYNIGAINWNHLIKSPSAALTTDKKKLPQISPLERREF